MSKKNKAAHLARIPTGRPVIPMPPGASPGVGGPPVRQKISEIDGLKWRLAVQKEQTLLAKQNEIQRYKDLLAREEENLRLRIALLQMENARDIGHLHLDKSDKVVQENGEWFVERAPRQGPMPKIGAPVNLPKPETPESEELPPPPSAEDETDEDEADEDDETEETPAEPTKA